MNTAAKAILWLLAVALAVLALLFGAYFVHGSLEQFPTDEQQGKARIVAGLGFILFALLATAVVAVLRWKRRTPTGTEH